MKRLLSVSLSIFVISWIAFGIISSDQGKASLVPIESDKITSVENIASIDRVAGVDRTEMQNLVGNSSTRPNSTNSRELPIEVIMDELVFHFRFLRNRAAEASQRGRNPQGLSEYYKRRLGLTDAENVALKQVLSEADLSIKNFDERLRTVTLAYRNQVRNGVVPGEKPPSIPAELRVLDQQRNLVLSQLPVTLRTQMGESGFAKLNAFISDELAPRIRATMLQNQGGSNPRQSFRSN